MTTDRMNTLLLEVAKRCEDCLPIREGEWLTENRVSIGELFEVLQMIGQIIAGYARADEETRDIIILNGVVDDPEMGKYIKRATHYVHAVKELEKLDV